MQVQAVQQPLFSFRFNFISSSKVRQGAIQGGAQHRPAQFSFSPMSMASVSPPPLSVLLALAPSSSSSSSSPSAHGRFTCAAWPDSEREGSVPLLDEAPARNSFWQSKAGARFALVLVSAFWGTYGPAVRFVYEQPYPPSPSLLTLARKALSVLFFFCFLPLETSNTVQGPEHVNDKPASQEENFQVDQERYSAFNQLPGFLTDILGVEWFAAIELGLWTFLGTACQTDGLENTTATRAGFLLQSVTVLVPVLSTFAGVRVMKATWIATFLALLGVTFLSLQSQLGALVSFSWNDLSSNLDISKGDLEMLLAALFYAFCTVRLGNYAAKVQTVQLSTKLMVISTILAVLWFLTDPAGTKLQALPSTNIILAIIFSALVPGTLASLGQTFGQKYISAAEAQVYFSLQPFFSAIFAAIVLKEDIDMATWAAGFILFIAALITSIESLSNE